MRLPKSCQASVQATKPLRSSLIARCSSGRWKNNTGNTRSAEVCCSSVTRETRPQKHPSGCIVRYRQAKSVRSGARDVLETPGGKDKWTEAGDYKGLTDTAETYAEHEASAFEIIMDDDDDDDGLDAESVAKKPRFGPQSSSLNPVCRTKRLREGLSYSSDWVGKVYRSWRDENRHTEIVPKQNPPADE